MGFLNNYYTGAGLECESQDITLSADANNLAIESSVVRLFPDAARNITGLDGSAFPFDTSDDAPVVFLTNADGTHNVTLKHNSGASSAGNRIFVSNNADKVLGPYQMVVLIYQNVAGRVGWWVNA